MKYPRPPICNVATKLKKDTGTLREESHSALSAFCDLRALAALVVCLAGLTLVALAVAPANYSAGNANTVVGTNDAGAVTSPHDGDRGTKPDRIGVALPATGWVATGSLATARGRHTTTLLPSGKVLVVGGNDESGGLFTGYLSSAELYDPATGSWSSTGSLHTARGDHTATLLPNGKVLVAGGSYT